MLSRRDLDFLTVYYINLACVNQATLKIHWFYFFYCVPYNTGQAIVLLILVRILITVASASAERREKTADFHTRFSSPPKSNPIFFLSVVRHVILTTQQQHPLSHPETSSSPSHTPPLALAVPPLPKHLHHIHHAPLPRRRPLLLLCASLRCFSCSGRAGESAGK